MQHNQEELDQLEANLKTMEKSMAVGDCASTKKSITISYHTFGDLATSPNGCMLLVMGLNGQSLIFDERFCLALVEAGFFVVRYDNRDVGLSTKFDEPEFAGPGIMSIGFLPVSWQATAPYTLLDMAIDGLRLLDGLGIEKTHLLGVSMGGMLVQTMALHAPHRVLSLTSIMSNSGSGRSQGPTFRARMTMLNKPKSNEPEDLAAFRVEWQTIMTGTYPFDTLEAYTRNLYIARRSNYNFGMTRQLAAIVQAPSRAGSMAKLAQEGLPVVNEPSAQAEATNTNANTTTPKQKAVPAHLTTKLPFPVLVLHGAADILVPVLNGIQTATALRGEKLANATHLYNENAKPFAVNEQEKVSDENRESEGEQKKVTGKVYDDEWVRLVVVDGMGHVMPISMFPFFVKEVVAVAKRGME
jgi:pimeloyl-ACP methyl ester carboxylesterase